MFFAICFSYHILILLWITTSNRLAVAINTIGVPAHRALEVRLECQCGTDTAWCCFFFFDETASVDDFA